MSSASYCMSLRGTLAAEITQAIKFNGNPFNEYKKMILLILICSFLASGEKHDKFEVMRSYIFKLQKQTTSTARAIWRRPKAMVMFFIIREQWWFYDSEDNWNNKNPLDNLNLDQQRWFIQVDKHEAMRSILINDQFFGSWW